MIGYTQRYFFYACIRNVVGDRYWYRESTQYQALVYRIISTEDIFLAFIIWQLYMFPIIVGANDERGFPDINNFLSTNTSVPFRAATVSVLVLCSLIWNQNVWNNFVFFLSYRNSLPNVLWSFAHVHGVGAETICV